MRKQRVILEYQPHAAPMRWQIKPAGGIKPILSATHHAAACRLMQPGNGAQRRGFTRA